MVKKLTNNLKHKHHHVYFDDVFTSVHLLEQLAEIGSMVVVQHERIERVSHLP